MKNLIYIAPVFAGAVILMASMNKHLPPAYAYIVAVACVVCYVIGTLDHD